MHFSCDTDMLLVLSRFTHLLHIQLGSYVCEHQSGEWKGRTTEDAYPTLCPGKRYEAVLIRSVSKGAVEQHWVDQLDLMFRSSSSRCASSA
jgi:hypothetical protein